jgi:hypothetical protein
LNRKFVLLNLVLLALIAACIWALRVRWIEAQARERAMLQRAAERRMLFPPPPLTLPKSVTPVEYVDVAQKMLFAKDRNPNVILDAPPPPPPPPPMPPLPSYHGQMAIGDPIVFLSLANKEQKRYRAGDNVGPFKVVSFNSEIITLDWDGKTVERRLVDLAPKETPAARVQPAAPSPAAAAAAATGAPAVKSLSGNSDNNPTPGFDTGPGFKACNANDNSPNGTIVDGYKKVVAQGMMGKSCYWEKVN